MLMTKPLLHQNDIMQRRDDCENESRSQRFFAGDPHPTYWMDFQQENEKDGGDLRHSIGFSEEARLEITQPGNGK